MDYIEAIEEQIEQLQDFQIRLTDDDESSASEICKVAMTITQLCYTAAEMTRR